MTLEQILDYANENRVEDGEMGMTACKEHIVKCKNFLKEDYFTQLKKYVDYANEMPFFNKLMVLACWEIMKEEF